VYVGKFPDLPVKGERTEVPESRTNILNKINLSARFQKCHSAWAINIVTLTLKIILRIKQLNGHTEFMGALQDVDFFLGGGENVRIMSILMLIKNPGNCLFNNNYTINYPKFIVYYTIYYSYKIKKAIQ